ncbi:MAG: GNAT family N-acetyltransferase [Alphaproteobacteria bacterium]|nr:GNAT family N-acetyltransferase [Alphaproteobacteria bacterium]
MNNIKFKEILNGERLALKIPTANFETARMLFSVVSRNREHLGKWLPWVAKNTQPEHSYDFLQSIVKGFNENTKAEYFIYEKSTGDFCGICSAHTHFSPTHKYISLGYWLDKEKCGKGYMTEAVKLIEDDLFTQNATRLIIQNDIENMGSVNVPKRLGYHLEGIARADFYSEYLGSYRDIYTWSKLHPNIEKQRG